MITTLAKQLVPGGLTVRIDSAMTCLLDLVDDLVVQAREKSVREYVEHNVGTFVPGGMGYAAVLFKLVLVWFYFAILPFAYFSVAIGLLKPQKDGARALLQKLKDPNVTARKEAVQSMANLKPKELAKHAAALVVTLDDSEWQVRKAAVRTMARLEPTDLANHAAALVSTLKASASSGYSGYANVRKAAVQTMAELEPTELAKYEGALQQAADEDKNINVREAATNVLAKLLLNQLEDPTSDVRKEAAQAMANLQPKELAKHAAALAFVLDDSEWHVRKAAVRTMARLEPKELANHAAALVSTLKASASSGYSGYAYVRKAVVQTLAKLEPAELAGHAEALRMAAKEDKDSAVREAATNVLAKLQASG